MRFQGSPTRAGLYERVSRHHPSTLETSNTAEQEADEAEMNLDASSRRTLEAQDDSIKKAGVVRERSLPVRMAHLIFLLYEPSKPLRWCDYRWKTGINLANTIISISRCASSKLDAGRRQQVGIGMEIIINVQNFFFFSHSCCDIHGAVTLLLPISIMTIANKTRAGGGRKAKLVWPHFRLRVCELWFLSSCCGYGRIIILDSALR